MYIGGEKFKFRDDWFKLILDEIVNTKYGSKLKIQLSVKFKKRNLLVKF